jgi:NodT family efflux transporter outer membrane factor (OMF) lipoprotein
MRRFGSLGLAGVLAGCTVGPNFVPPAPPVGPAFVHGAPGTTTASNPNPLWWAQFQDPVLNGLMARAIAGNPSLQEAVLRIVEAHQDVAETAAQGLPQLNASGSYMREELGVKGLLESQGAYSGLNSLAGPVNAMQPGLGTVVAGDGKHELNAISAPVNLFQYELSASWELDLFGLVRRQVEGAKATQEADVDAADDSLVMLESEVGQEYFALRAAQMGLAEQQRQVKIAADILKLTQDQAAIGLTSDINVDQARTQYLSEQSQLQSYQKQIGQAIDELNDLVGAQPGTLDAELAVPAPLPALTGLIGVGVPSTLARRRPDVREAEAQLHAATAEVGVAVASFYPDVTLMGSDGFRALDASYLTNWASNFYSAGPSISLPIFEGGKLRAQLKLAKAAQKSAAISYRATVLEALREVEDALLSYRTDSAAQADAAATAQSAEDAAALARNRAQNGLESFLTVLSTEQSAVSAEQQLVQADEQQAEDIVTLYTALGGGWQDSKQVK